MLSPNDRSPKGAPSIWSFDSGYGTTTMLDEEDALVQSMQSLGCRSSDNLQVKGQKPMGLGLNDLFDTDSFDFGSTTNPMGTDLCVYASNTSGSDFPFSNSNEERPCVQCDAWNISDPGEGIKCHKCRIPAIIEPASAFLGEVSSRSKMSYPKLAIPGQDRQQPVFRVDITSGSRSGIMSNAARNGQRCSACELSALVSPSDSKVCSSCSLDPSFLSPTAPSSPQDRISRSRAGRNSKLPFHALNRLQQWLDANQHNPYPTAENKRLLAQECGITEKQVTTWFTNARARQLNSPDTYLSASGGDDETTDSEMAEPVTDTLPSSMGGYAFVSDGRQQGQYGRTTSVSGSSVFSPSQARQRPCRRGKKKDYRRSKAKSNAPAQSFTLFSPAIVQSPLEYIPSQNDHTFPAHPMTATMAANAAAAAASTVHSSMSDAPATNTSSDAEMWQCTFCQKSLVPKSWRRHEETQHRPKAQWTCMLYGPRLSLPARSKSNSICAFCMQKNPAEDHFQTNHRIEDCAKRDAADRTFFRPDHLRQHVKNFHNASLFDIVQARWKRAAETASQGWFCGFCGERLDTWDKRETHIAYHFKSGLTMASWQEYDEEKNGKNRKPKKKEKESHIRGGLARLAQPFTRRSNRALYTTDAPPPRQQSQHHIVPQPTFPNVFQQIPSTNAFGVSMAQPPVLPALSPLDPLSMDCDIDWSTIPNPPLPGTRQAQMQYPLTAMPGFDDASQTARFEQELGMGMQNIDIDVGLYGNPIEYQGPPWDVQHQH